MAERNPDKSALSRPTSAGSAKTGRKACQPRLPLLPQTRSDRRIGGCAWPAGSPTNSAPEPRATPGGSSTSVRVRQSHRSWPKGPGFSFGLRAKREHQVIRFVCDGEVELLTFDHLAEQLEIAPLLAVEAQDRPNQPNGPAKESQRIRQGHDETREPVARPTQSHRRTARTRASVVRPHAARPAGLDQPPAK